MASEDAGGVMLTVALALALLSLQAAPEPDPLLSLVTQKAWSQVIEQAGARLAAEPDFLLMPLYGFLHVGLVFPARLLALVTLWDTRWGTR